MSRRLQSFIRIVLLVGAGTVIGYWLKDGGAGSGLLLSSARAQEREKDASRKGPVAKLPGGVATYEELAGLSADNIRTKELFPYTPLAHPLQTTAHMLFPYQWTKVHPEHERMDVDLDIPDEYLPEFPPPMFLTTHKELGDVTQGREITLGNSAIAWATLTRSWISRRRPGSIR